MIALRPPQEDTVRKNCPEGPGSCAIDTAQGSRLPTWHFINFPSRSLSLRETDDIAVPMSQVEFLAATSYVHFGQAQLSPLVPPS